jgi:hypothetical protein
MPQFRNKAQLTTVSKAEMIVTHALEGSLD